MMSSRRLCIAYLESLEQRTITIYNRTILEYEPITNRILLTRYPHCI